MYAFDRDRRGERDVQCTRAIGGRHDDAAVRPTIAAFAIETYVASVGLSHYGVRRSAQIEEAGGACLALVHAGDREGWQRGSDRRQRRRAGEVASRKVARIQIRHAIKSLEEESSPSRRRLSR